MLDPFQKPVSLHDIFMVSPLAISHQINIKLDNPELWTFAPQQSLWQFIMYEGCLDWHTNPDSNPQIHKKHLWRFSWRHLPSLFLEHIIFRCNSISWNWSVGGLVGWCVGDAFWKFNEIYNYQGCDNKYWPTKDQWILYQCSSTALYKSADMKWLKWP